ncbi:MAG: hypothetical protein Q8M98_06920 [Candidatus Cloacimonadaceae bacterium]|nr:hypothetical protein [Candidatus Cloacimonadaceae bacterium]MDP3114492.1 hypothetical protein [Candidatus Cloacimonadaceae bacterium]
MSKFFYYTALLLAVIVLSACESGGKFRVVNQTSYPVYVRVGDFPEVTIPSDSEHLFDLETGNQSFFTGTVEETVPVRIIGETYSLEDGIEGVWTDSTWVKIAVGKTTNAYLAPNRACIKIVNASTQNIVSALIYRHNFISASHIATLQNIAPGEFQFLRVNYATANSNFYYYVSLQLADGNTYQYGGESTILLKDQQFLITLTDPQ